MNVYVQWEYQEPGSKKWVPDPLPSGPTSLDNLPRFIATQLAGVDTANKQRFSVTLSFQAPPVPQPEGRWVSEEE